MRNIVLISYTPLDHVGGVNRWNRDFIAGFPDARHYSWWDVLKYVGSIQVPLHEWDQARLLNKWLLHTKKIKKDDIIIVDGFWGLEIPKDFNVISVAHGIWSHLTFEDCLLGKQAEFPIHNAVQVEYRKRHLESGGKIVAVSQFIKDQMSLQWGFDSTVINNSIDLEKFSPVQKYYPRQDEQRVIVHGVTTKNKGFDHIEAVKKALPNDKVLLLDEAAEYFELPKYNALAKADLVVQPSAYEGNSYFVLECLSCNVPVVAYNVGLMYSTKKEGLENKVGEILDRKERSPERTVEATRRLLRRIDEHDSLIDPRGYASQFSIEKFHSEWKDFINREFGRKY